MIKEDFDKWGSLSPQIESVYIIQAEIHFPGFGEGKHMGLKERIMDYSQAMSQNKSYMLWIPGIDHENVFIFYILLSQRMHSVTPCLASWEMKCEIFFSGQY